MTRLGGMKKELHDFKNEFSTQLSDLSNSLNEKFDSLYKLLGESEGKIKANINDIVTVSLMTNTPVGITLKLREFLQQCQTTILNTRCLIYVSQLISLLRIVILRDVTEMVRAIQIPQL